VSDLIDTTEMYLRTIYELVEEDIVPLRARIAERLHQSGPTVSQTVARMERDGLIRRVTDDSDARRQRVWLTARARALEGPATAAATDLNGVALRDLDDAETATFLAMLRRVIGALERPGR